MKKVITFTLALLASFILLNAYAQDYTPATAITITKPAVKVNINNIRIGDGVIVVNLNYLDEDDNVVRNEDVEIRDIPESVDEEGNPIAGTGSTAYSTLVGVKIQAGDVGTSVAGKFRTLLKQAVKQIKGW